MAAENKNCCILNIHTSASMIPLSCPIDLARWLSGDEEPCAQQDLKKITKSVWFESLIQLCALNGHTMWVNGTDFFNMIPHLSFLQRLGEIYPYIPYLPLPQILFSFFLVFFFLSDTLFIPTFTASVVKGYLSFLSSEICLLACCIRKA